MTNFRNYLIALPILICGKIEAQVSHSPNISLNKVFLNPAFAGEKEKIRISMQNTYSIEQFDEKITGKAAEAGRDYYLNSHQFSLDGFIKSKRIGYFVSYGSTESTQVEHIFGGELAQVKGDEKSKVSESVSNFRRNDKVSNNTFGAGLNYKFILQGNNPGTLSLGAGIYVNKFNTSYTSTRNGIKNYEFTEDVSKNRSTRYNTDGKDALSLNPQLSKLNLGVSYNKKNSYISTNVAYMQNSKFGNYANFGAMAGTVIAKNAGEDLDPVLFFVPQVAFSFNKKVGDSKKEFGFKQKSFSSETDYTTSAKTLDTSFVEGDYQEIDFKDNRLLSNANTFMGVVNYSINLDMHYKKLIVGLVRSSRGTGFNLGANFKKVKIVYNLGIIYAKNGKDDFKRGATSSLSTNIVF